MLPLYTDPSGPASPRRLSVFIRKRKIDTKPMTTTLAAKPMTKVTMSSFFQLNPFFLGWPERSSGPVGAALPGLKNDPSGIDSSALTGEATGGPDLTALANIGGGGRG